MASLGDHLRAGPLAAWTLRPRSMKEVEAKVGSKKAPMGVVPLLPID
jgi:hypothetical protein